MELAFPEGHVESIEGAWSLKEVKMPDLLRRCPVLDV